MIAPKNIAVFPPPRDPRINHLLASLAGAFEMRFFPVASLDALRHDALLLLADDDASLLRRFSSSTAVFSSPALGDTGVPLAGTVQFADLEELDPSLRGQSLPCSLQASLRPVELPHFIPRASIGDQPVWLVPAEKTSPLLCRSHLSVPGLAEHEELIDQLQESAFIGLLPLVDFLRRLGGDRHLQRPALRATLIIDDPNLHSPRYGFIDYRKFAAHARATRFHGCMATVPFDGWFTNRATAAIFKDNSDVLSLALHGNDHEFKELAQSVSSDAALRVIAQARKRIARVERSSGLSIDPVMVPPHGACSLPYLEAMARTGFYGTTTTRGAIWTYAGIKQREPGAGMALAEICGGLPIVQRFRFNSDRWRHRVAISAYLRHPLIAYGHHEDFAGGFGRFDAVASQINKLGAKWVRPAALFASNFETKREGDVIWIKPFSRHIVIPSLAACLEVRLDVRGFAGGWADTLQVSMEGSSPVSYGSKDGTVSIPVNGAGRIEITLESGNQVDWRRVPERQTRWPSAIRRVMSEARDRWTQLRA